jgi:hypothetical protein
MRLLRYGLIGLCLLLAAPVAAAAEEGEEEGSFIQEFDNGQIDWQVGKVTAVGIGAAPANAVNKAQARGMAKRAATVVARRNLLELLQGVRIDSTTTVLNHMVADDSVNSRVRGLLHNSRIMDTAYMSDGSVEVTVGVGLRGGLADTLLSRSTSFETALIEPPAQEAMAETTEGVVAQPVYTGLVVDARELGIRPALSPRIFDEEGKEVYGAAFASREYAIKQGVAGYANNLDRALDNPRVGNNPFLAQAVAVSGDAGADLVISNDTAATVRAVAAKNNFLEQCRVMIVLD